MNKNNIGFRFFLLDDPELYRFYSEQMNNNSLYYALYIEKPTREVSSETKEVLHLRENAILLVDSYLIPIFYRLRLEGCAIIILEPFCSLRDRALLKSSFFHNQPEGIIDMGCVNTYQKKCINVLYTEFYSRYDELQVSVLRNLLVNIALLSPTVDYEGQFKFGHLLNYALQLVDLVDNYAFSEKKKKFYINKIGVTEKTLDKSLQCIYRKTFREILANRIMIEAMKLLVFSDKTITRIAYELGYDVSNFIKFFFQRKGIHPKDLRTNYRRIITEIENGY
jgi:AraC-like DNA-binding protein